MIRLTTILALFFLVISVKTAASNDEVEPSTNWLDKAKSDQQIYRMTSIFDPRRGFIFRRQESETGEFNLVFVTCNYEVLTINEAEVAPGSGKCGDSNPSTVISTTDVSLKALLGDISTANTILMWSGREGVPLPLSAREFLINGSGNLEGILVPTGENTAQTKFQYLNADQIQIFASSTIEGDRKFAVVPLVDFEELEPVNASNIFLSDTVTIGGSARSYDFGSGRLVPYGYDQVDGGQVIEVVVAEKVNGVNIGMAFEF